MKYLLFALVISTAAFARDPYTTDMVRSITFDEKYKEMTVKLMDNQHKVYAIAEDSRAGKCLKNAYRGQVKVKVHLTDDGDDIENCVMMPNVPESLPGTNPI